MVSIALEKLLMGNLSQTRFNFIVILWLSALSVLTGFWVWHDYAGVQERNRKLLQIYNKNIEQQSRYDAILQKQEEEIGIPNGKTR